jgi:hypothetical protein
MIEDGLGLNVKHLPKSPNRESWSCSLSTIQGFGIIYGYYKMKSIITGMATSLQLI